jgi:hypothetical protein
MVKKTITVGLAGGGGEVVICDRKDLLLNNHPIHN